MQDGQYMLKQMLINGFESFPAVLNNLKQTRVVITSKYSSTGEIRTVIGDINEIKRGNLLLIENNHWLVTTLPDNNKIYHKAEVRLCNQTFKIETNRTSVIAGYNKLKEPQFKEVIEYKDEPCVVFSSYYSSNENSQLPQPEGRVTILLRYQVAPNLVLNHRFLISGTNYVITDIDDFTQVINGEGILRVVAEKA